MHTFPTCFCLQRRHVGYTHFGTFEFANSIRRFCETLQACHHTASFKPELCGGVAPHNSYSLGGYMPPQFYCFSKTRTLSTAGCDRSTPNELRRHLPRWSDHTPMEEDTCKPCHHFLYSGGAFVRLYPVNLTPTRNHTTKPKRRPRGRYRFALDMW